MKTLMFCVNYNSYLELDNYLQSIKKAYEYYKDKNELAIVVTDNSKNTKKIKIDYPFDVQQIITGKNLGYFGGISYAIKHNTNRLLEFDYVIFSNVDLIMSESFFSDLYNLNLNEKEIGCIAPTILSLNERQNRNPKVLKRYSIKKLKLLRLMYKFPILYYLYTSIFYSKRRQRMQQRGEGSIYAAHGSFMIFTRRFASFLQEMRYPVFMFGEELFIAENLKKQGLMTYYLPNIIIYDTDHVSTSKMKSNFYFKCNYEALDMLIKEYYDE